MPGEKPYDEKGMIGFMKGQLCLKTKWLSCHCFRVD